MNSLTRAQAIRKMLEAHPEIIEEMSHRLALPCSAEEKSSPGNICFMNDEEVMPEFRLSFNQQDMMHYILGLTSANDPEILFANFQYPHDITSFWNRMKQGKASL